MSSETVEKIETVDLGRRRFLTAATSVVGAVGVGFVAVPFLGSWSPSKRAVAAGAPVEADISKLEFGQSIKIEWRGRSVIILRRDEETLAKLEEIESNLLDPNSDAEQQPAYAKNRHRSINPEYLVLLSWCTHLGCSPTYLPEVTADWAGGFICPCHGSQFDMSGRVYSAMPAPSNLIVPPHQYISDTVVLIGNDEGAEA